MSGGPSGNERGLPPDPPPATGEGAGIAMSIPAYWRTVALATVTSIDALPTVDCARRATRPVAFALLPAPALPPAATCENGEPVARLVAWMFGVCTAPIQSTSALTDGPPARLNAAAFPTNVSAATSKACVKCEPVTSNETAQQ